MATIKFNDIVLHSFVGGDKDTSFTNLSVENQVLLMSQLTPLYWQAEHIDAAINNYILDKTDFYHTFLRVWQVTENVMLNHTNSDADRTDSSFNHTIHAHGEIAILSIVPAIIGFGLYWHELTQTRKRHTRTYQTQHVTAALKKSGAIESPIAPALYHETMQGLLDRQKIILVPKILVPKILVPKINKQPDVSIDEATEETPLLATSTDRPTTARPTTAQRFFVRIKQGVASTWSFLVQSALVFWPAWMIAVLKVGFAASYAFPVLPLVVLASFVTAALIKGALHYLRKKAAKTAQAIEEKIPNINELREESRDMQMIRSRLIQRTHRKLKHQQFKNIFTKSYQTLYPSTPSPVLAHTPTNATYRVCETNTDQVIVLLREENKEKEETAPIQLEPICLPDQQTMEDTLKQSHIGQMILNNKKTDHHHGRIVKIDQFIRSYTLSAFVCWIVGAAFLSLGLLTDLLTTGGITTILMIVANLALGATAPWVSTLFNVIYGMIAGKKAHDELKQANNARLQAAYVQLSAPYTSTKWLEKIRQFHNLPDAPIVTQQQAFDYFQAQVEQTKLNIANQLHVKQALLKQRLKKGETLTTEENGLLNFNIKEINALNDRLFTEQEATPTLWMRLQEWCTTLYKSIAAAQTWIFVTRSLFLAGALLAGVSLLFGPAAPAVFIGIAITMAVSGITIRLIKNYLEKKAHSQQFLIDTFPDRISDLKKHYKCLKTLEQTLSMSSTTDILSEISQNKTVETEPNIQASLNVTEINKSNTLETEPKISVPLNFSATKKSATPLSLLSNTSYSPTPPSDTSSGRESGNGPSLNNSSLPHELSRFINTSSA